MKQTKQAKQAKRKSKAKQAKQTQQANHANQAKQAKHALSAGRVDTKRGHHQCGSGRATRRALNANTIKALGAQHVARRAGTSHPVTSHHVMLEMEESKQENKRAIRKCARDASARLMLNANMLTALGARDASTRRAGTSRPVTSRHVLNVRKQHKKASERLVNGRATRRRDARSTPTFSALSARCVDARERHVPSHQVTSRLQCKKANQESKRRNILSRHWHTTKLKSDSA